ncbi:MAG: CHASE2 domain-containing protein, partial [Spirochaetaceae bacterium]
MKRYLFIIVPVLAVLMCSLLLLTTLDHRVYDLFLRAIPSLTEDDSVLIIKVDDEAIENVGLFPWPRDILADAIVFLREMGADTVVFDLSYLDNSPATVAPRYVNEELPRHLQHSFEEIDFTIAQVMDGVASGFIGPADAELYKEQILEFNRSIKNSLGASISHVTRDVDAYFAGALGLFGSSFLTLTMVDPDDLIIEDPLLIDMDEVHGEEPTFDMSFYDIDWLKENIALHNVTAINDTRTPRQIGIIPAIETLLRRSHGAGFVNAQPDADGYRRRLHLLMKHDGQYYGQLAFVPLLEFLGHPAIEVTNSSITLQGAMLNGTPQDIRIPRAEDGSVLVKWPKKQFRDYNQISSWQLIRNASQEGRLVRNLEAMEESGFFGYWDDGPPPLVYYDNAEYLKELLFEAGAAGQTGAEDAAGTNGTEDERISFEVYREQRNEFFDAADRLLNGGYEELLLSYIDPNDTEIIEYVSEFFAVTR